MSQLAEFLSDYTFQTVAMGAALLGALSGVMGTFAVLRRESLLGDGVSHGALPGVVLAFLLTGSKRTEVLLLGALATGIIAVFSVAGIVKHSRVRFDAALAVVTSVLFGLGMVLLTYAQRIPNANQAGLKRFLYGQASTLLLRDVRMTALAGGGILGIALLLWKEWKLLAFDPEFAAAAGFPVGMWKFLLSFLTVLTIVMGLQTVGVVLMSAMLIAPAVAARQWCSHLGSMAGLAALFGAGSGIVGTGISSLYPGLPTGPVIVVCATAIAGFSLLAAPGRGILYRIWQRKENQKRWKGAAK